MSYDHRNPTRFSFAECEEAVGKRAYLTFAGKVIEARDGPSGPFVMFQADERFGFPTKLGIDLDLLDLDETQREGEV